MAMKLSSFNFYHIDTSVLSDIARNDQNASKLSNYLYSHKAIILISDILMYEIIKNSDKDQVDRMLNLLSKTPNKAYLNLELIHLHWIELVDYFEFGHTLSSLEFKLKHIKQFKKNEWDKFVSTMFLKTDQIEQDINKWTNDWVFGKMISKAAMDRNRKPMLVKDMLNAPNISNDNFKPLDLSNPNYS